MIITVLTRGLLLVLLNSEKMRRTNVTIYGSVPAWDPDMIQLPAPQRMGTIAIEEIECICEGSTEITSSDASPGSDSAEGSSQNALHTATTQTQHAPRTHSTMRVQENQNSDNQVSENRGRGRRGRGYRSRGGGRWRGSGRGGARNFGSFRRQHREKPPLMNTKPGSKHYVDIHCWQCNQMLLFHQDIYKIWNNAIWGSAGGTETDRGDLKLRTDDHIVLSEERRYNAHKDQYHQNLFCSRCGVLAFHKRKGDYYEGYGKWKFFYANNNTNYLKPAYGFETLQEALDMHTPLDPSDTTPVPFSQRYAKQTVNKVLQKTQVDLPEEEVEALQQTHGSLNRIELIRDQIRANVQSEVESMKKQLEDLKAEVKEAANSKMDSGTRGKMEELKKELGEDEEVPDFYRCPITSEIMKEPVVGKDGHTYEKEAIHMWLERRGTSPLTDESLSREDLFPNYNLKKAIDSFARQYIPNWNEIIEDVHRRERSQSPNDTEASKHEDNKSDPTPQDIDTKKWEPEKKKQ